MDTYIVDANVIFSSALNLENRIGQFIMSANKRRIKFFAPIYLRGEIERHAPKILKIAGFSDDTLRRILQLLYSQIEFVADDQIPMDAYFIALKWVKDVDTDDIAFVALTEYLDEILWTGDTELYDGLIAKGYKKVVNFEDLKKKYGLLY